MPQIGEIRKGAGLGRPKRRESYIWTTCTDCGKPRWVVLCHGKPEYTRCSSCGKKGSRSKQWLPNGRPIYICLQCKQPFSKRAPNIPRGTGIKFCSLQCAYKHNRGSQSAIWKGGPIQYTCLECGKEFMRRRDRALNPKFCSCLCKVIYYKKHGVWISRPTNPERKVIRICLSHNLPYKYVGDGQVWLGNRNPDFINVNGEKQVIEVFGTYFHHLFDGANRIEHYRKYGFSCLIIWGDELSNMQRVTKKLLNFAKVKCN